MQKITLYSKDNCPYCVLAKNLLTSIGATYEEVDITTTPGLIMELVKRSGMRTVPQIYIWDECLGGYSDIAILHEKGELIGKIGI
jgi:glutaredoxin 3